MDNAERRIVRTVVRLRGRRGDRFAVVEFDDGGFGIQRDDQLLQLQYFPRHEIDTCINCLITLAGLDES